MVDKSIDLTIITSGKLSTFNAHMKNQIYSSSCFKGLDKTTNFSQVVGFFHFLKSFACSGDNTCASFFTRQIVSYI